MTLTEVCQQVGLGPRTVRQYIYDGLVKPEKRLVHGAWRWWFTDPDVRRICSILQQKAQRKRLLQPHLQAWYEQQHPERMQARTPRRPEF